MRVGRRVRLRMRRVRRAGQAKPAPAQARPHAMALRPPLQAPISTGVAIWTRSVHGNARRAVRRRRRSARWAHRRAARRRVVAPSMHSWPTGYRARVVPIAGMRTRVQACSRCRCSRWTRFAIPAANGETGGTRESMCRPRESCDQRAGASCAIASRTKPSSVSSVHESFVSAGSFISAWRNFACVAGSWPA